MVVYKARTLLIRLGKVLPFIVCFIITISYTESVFALLTNDFIGYDGYVIPNKPISFFIGQYFEYNIQTLFVLSVISIAIQTCLYNKLACLYLGVNLIEKSYFDFEIEVNTVYVIAIINIIVSAWIIYKGIKILTIK
jgi:hypothetical protein